ILLVVLGSGRRACRAAGAGAATARARDAHDHGQRSARQLHARAASATRPARVSAVRRHPCRSFRDRAGERVSAEYRPLAPRVADAHGREHQIVFAGRQEPRKGLHVLLRAWPDIRRRTDARLRIAGADPLAVRLLLTRDRLSDDGIDILGLLSQEELTAELL